MLCWTVSLCSREVDCKEFCPELICVCEIWSLTWREEYRLRVFGNKLLRRIFGPKREEVTEGRRKVHNEELHNLYSSPFFSTGFCSPYLRTLAFLSGLLDPQTFGRIPWLGDQSNARPVPTHRTTQHRNKQTHIHAPSRIRTCDLNVQAVIDRPLGYWDRH
jgi:hypothetical protein